MTMGPEPITRIDLQIVGAARGDSFRTQRSRPAPARVADIRSRK